MTRRGSAVVYCPACRASHLAGAMERQDGAWIIRCRWCGPVAWRAVVSLTELAALTAPQLAAVARAAQGGA